MNGGIGRLGELYGLSPATLAGLASIAGKPAPAPVDPNSPEAWAAAASAAGAPGAVKELAPGPNPYAQPTAPDAAGPKKYALDSHGYAVTENTLPGDVAERTGQSMAPDSTPQGPGHDGFPTVKSSDASAGGPGGAPAVAPSVTIPAHWQPGSHSVSLHHGMNPAELERGETLRDSAMGHGIIAADKRLEAAQAAGMADAVYASAHQMISQRTNERIAQINQQKDAYVAGEQKKFEQLSIATQKEVDPNAYFKSKGSAARFASALMIGLNEFAVLWRGRGTNTAKAIIDEEIQRNIDAQKTNIANARNALAARESVYGRNVAAFGDKERSELASKVQYLDQVMGLVEAKRATAKSVEAEAGAHDLLRALSADRANHADEFATKTHTQATEQMSEAFKPTQTLGGGAVGKGKDPLFVPTLGGYARDEQSARKLNEKGALRMQIGENMHKIHGLMDEAKKYSSADPTGYVRLQQIDEQIASYVDDALTKNTVLEGQGAMSAADKEVAQQAKGLKNTTVQYKLDSTIGRRQENIKKAAVGMLEQHRIEGEAYGVQKGSEQYVQGPNGPTPVQRLQGRNAAPSKNTQAHDDLVQAPQGVPQKRK